MALKLNVETVLTDLEGNELALANRADRIMDVINGNAPVPDQVAALLKLAGEENTPITFRKEAVKVMLHTEQTDTPEDKFKRARLAERLMGGPVVELDVDEAALIRERIGKFCSALVMTRCWDIIDNPITGEEGGDEPRPNQGEPDNAD